MHWLVFASPALASLAFASPASGQGAPPAKGSAADADDVVFPAAVTCPEAIVRRELMRDERGHLMLLSRDAFLARDSARLVTGVFGGTYVTDPGQPVRESSSDSLIAWIQSASGEVRTIARPNLGPWELREVLALGLPDGQWGLFLVTRDSSFSSRPEDGGPVWFLTAGAQGLVSLEQLPIPRGVRVMARSVPSVAQRGSRLVFATTARANDASDVILILERNAGRWRPRTIGGIDGVVYVAAAFHGRTNELVLSFVNADYSLRIDENSLFLLYPDRRLSAPERLVIGGTRPVHSPTMATTRDGVAIGWKRVPKGASLMGENPVWYTQTFGDSIAPPRRVGEDARRIMLEAGTASEPLVVLARSAPGDSTEIDLIAPRSEQAPLRLRLPSAGPAVMLAARSGSNVLVTLPTVLGGGTHLANEFVWIRTRCSAPEQHE